MRHQCPRCRVLHELDSSSCATCLKYMSKWRATARHRDYMREYMRGLRAVCRRLKLCYACKADAAPGFTKCEPCRERDRSYR